MSDSRNRRPWHTDAEWDRLRERIDAAAGDPAPLQRRNVRPFAWAAAAALLVVAAGVWRFSTREQSAYVQLATSAGERRTIQLDDSSVVTLGPQTTLRYRLTGKSRDVELNGLANFHVTHNEKRPFIVRAKNAITTDLGTEFSIRAYPGDTSVLVAVTAGRVALASTTGSRMELVMGRRGSVSSGGNALAYGELESSDVAWVSGILAFQDAPVREVAAELSRWFGTTVNVNGDAFGSRRITAQYVRPSLDDVLSALSTTLGARVERRAGMITLTPVAR